METEKIFEYREFYKTSDIIELGAVKSILDQNSIEYFVSGVHLNSILPRIPQVSEITVYVKEEKLGEYCELVRDYLKAEIVEEEKKE